MTTDTNPDELVVLASITRAAAEEEGPRPEEGAEGEAAGGGADASGEG